MKKVWRCPNCKQMSTRLGNLKRHVGRKHNGIGTPIMQYIIGKSIVTPEEAPTTLHVFCDEYTPGRPAKPFFHTHKSSNQNVSDWLNKWADTYIQPALEFNKLGVRMNAINQSLNPYGQYPFPQFNPPLSSFSSSPAYNVTERHPENYDGVSGFKVDVCVHCLTIVCIRIGSKDFRLQDIHKCHSMRVAAIMKLEPREYAIDLLQKQQSLPELLLRLCKDWARNTSGQLYMKLESTKLLSEREVNHHEIHKYDSLSFLARVLSESKISLTDTELLEFLRFARNQTRATLTIKSNSGEVYSEFNLAVMVA